MRSHDVLLSELRRSMAALSTEGRVYVRAGRYAESAPDMAELTAQIRALLTQVFEDPAWKRFLAPAVPPAAGAVEGSLELIEAGTAAGLLTSVASVDIVWPSHALMDHAVAARTAKRVVSLFGSDATWWTNHDSDCGAVNLLTPVFDSLIAGTDGTYYAIAVQVADD
ncbi:hypothetical protein [Streptomyces atroolivaceus]|uniref:hypothetical protein n=1 Tax=Streptomyces atroolivaceus TaxID=66869 RepID=UPI003635D527